MNKSVKSVLVLSLICLICAVLLAGANMITAPIIEENERIAAEAALREVLPGAEGFELVDKELYSEAYPDINEVKRASNGGYVFKITKTGYKSGLVIMCGVSADGKIKQCITRKKTTADFICDTAFCVTGCVNHSDFIISERK